LSVSKRPGWGEARRSRAGGPTQAPHQPTRAVRAAPERSGGAERWFDSSRPDHHEALRSDYGGLLQWVASQRPGWGERGEAERGAYTGPPPANPRGTRSPGAKRRGGALVRFQSPRPSRRPPSECGRASPIERIEATGLGGGEAKPSRGAYTGPPPANPRAARSPGAKRRGGALVRFQSPRPTPSIT